MKLPAIMRAARGGYQPGRHQARLAFALALSLLIHACILSLQFGTAGFGLPGFAMPWWGERRVFSQDLRVRLADVPPAPAAPAPETTVLAPLAVLTPAVATRAVTRQPKPAKPQRTEKPVDQLPPQETPKPAPAAEQPEIIAQKEAKQETFSVPPPAVREKQDEPDIADKEQLEAAAAAVKEQVARAQEQVARAQEQVTRAEQAARAREETEQRAKEEAIKLEEAAKLEEASKLEALRSAEEASRAAALARQQRADEQRRQEEEKKQQEARREALELEALRQAEDAARQQAAELARQRELEATRQAEELAAKQRAQELAERKRAEAEALAASQREKERLAAEAAPPRPPLSAAAPGTLSGRDLAAKALDQLRTPDPARAELQRPPPSFDFLKPSGRRSIAGGIDRDTRLRLYVDNWRAKIERNRDMNYPPSARTKPHEDPIVTVAVRNDGSLESVFIHRSSGLREIDDAVRRIAELYAPYGAFPPDLARVYDVIEIRHVWHFADTLRLLEEMR